MKTRKDIATVLEAVGVRSALPVEAVMSDVWIIVGWLVL